MFKQALSGGRSKFQLTNSCALRMTLMAISPLLATCTRPKGMRQRTQVH